MGVRNLNKGEIRIFGHKPGSRDAGVPGPNVGFMPQEIALYPELTISEILLYFGRLYGMSKKEVKESMEFLVGFLALPPPHRRVGSLRLVKPDLIKQFNDQAIQHFLHAHTYAFALSS